MTFSVHGCKTSVGSSVEVRVIEMHCHVPSSLRRKAAWSVMIVRVVEVLVEVDADDKTLIHDRGSRMTSMSAINLLTEPKERLV